MDGDAITAWGTAIGAVAAAIGVIFTGVQLLEQRKLSRQEIAIGLFQFCMQAFGKIIEDRVDINSTPENQEARARKNWVDYWDILAVEFELARADFLPDEVYARWFVLMRKEFNPSTRVGCIDAPQSWEDFGREYANLISPDFVKVVECALKSPVEQAKAIVTPAITSKRRAGIFGKLRA
jgi:hypothetical protein